MLLQKRASLMFKTRLIFDPPICASVAKHRCEFEPKALASNNTLQNLLVKYAYYEKLKSLCIL